MIRIVICDNDTTAADTLANSIKALAAAHRINYEIHCFSKGLPLLYEIEDDIQFDLRLEEAFLSAISQIETLHAQYYVLQSGTTRYNVSLFIVSYTLYVREIIVFFKMKLVSNIAFAAP